MSARRLETKTLTILQSMLDGRTSVQSDLLLPVGVQATDAIMLTPDYALAKPHVRLGLVFGWPTEDRALVPRRYLVVLDGAEIDGGRWRHIRSLYDRDGHILHVLEGVGP